VGCFVECRQCVRLPGNRVAGCEVRLSKPFRDAGRPARGGSCESMSLEENGALFRKGVIGYDTTPPSYAASLSVYVIYFLKN